MQAKQETKYSWEYWEMGKSWWRASTHHLSPEHTETKVQTAAQNYAATGMWAQEEQSLARPEVEDLL